MKKLPIGIQTFEKLREGDYLYADKTRLVYNLTHSGGNYFFLSRPRRFGKSLLLSTLKAYFEGKKNLFEGLEIMNLEHDWKQHPVLHLDLNTGDYTSVEGLWDMFRGHISRWETLYGMYSVLQTDDYIYIFEFKIDLPAKIGTKQIEERDYALPFANDPRKLLKVAVSFNTTKRNIDEWIINS